MSVNLSSFLFGGMSAEVSESQSNYKILLIAIQNLFHDSLSARCSSIRIVTFTYFKEEHIPRADVIYMA